MAEKHTSDNLLIGSGRVYFKPESENGYHDLGEMDEIQFRTISEVRKHRSNRDGSKKVDKVTNIVSEGEATFQCASFNISNLRKFFMEILDIFFNS